ncbi:hypothetical protein [uncultured Paracoccus sp.]|uniref:hypothetical protein n=1 Tax=uncultured Paracoccus sp. TaxID=189685 RepID=UPI00262667C8|nr:hypothetical protein [uncultured Paracoccus sp.]
MPDGPTLRSRIVRGLRVVFPLAALGILSLLFLLARQPSGDRAIPYVEADAEALAQKTGMTAPRFAGVTRDGAQLALRAAQAVPEGEGGDGEGSARDVVLDWQARDGLTARLVAADGSVADGLIHLSGGVTMTTSTGWKVTAPVVEASTGADRIVAPARVSAEAPFGTVDAAAMDLRRQPDGTHVLDLNGGVRLLYRP